MALFDFLKRKKEVEKNKEKKPEKVLVKKNLNAVKSEKTEEKVKPVSTKAKVKQGSFSYQLIKEPHISEKASYLSESHKYVFKVYSNVNKPEIKKSIEGIYGVDVLSVNIIKIRAKKRRIGKTQGFKKGYNKAIVTIKKGQKIEIL